MKKVIKSSDIVDLIEGVVIPVLSDESDDIGHDVGSTEVQSIRTARYVKKGGKLPPEGTVITDFRSDPLSGTASWYEVIDNVEYNYSMTFSEIDFFMFGYQYQPYTSYPGIYLTIKEGVRSKTSKSLGTRYDPGKTKTYVHAPSYRCDATKMYQEFSSLVNKARSDGINGLNFPGEWDEIPYVV